MNNKEESDATPREMADETTTKTKLMQCVSAPSNDDLYDLEEKKEMMQCVWVYRLSARSNTV